MRMATSSSTRRGRQSGADLKPPQAAVVKSDGGERCGKVGTRFRQARLREASASEPLQKCRSKRGRETLRDDRNAAGKRSDIVFRKSDRCLSAQYDGGQAAA